MDRPAARARTAEPDTQYVVSEQVPRIGPARVIVGSYAGAPSPARAPVIRGGQYPELYGIQAAADR